MLEGAVNVVTQALRWYFAPGLAVARAARKPRRAVRFFLMVSFTRLAVLGTFIWSIITQRWFAAGLLVGVMVLMGLLSWTIAGWILKRTGGSHGAR